ncbi:MAG: carboxylesterase/lipase family protein [Promethearchaeota archaeon]
MEKTQTVEIKSGKLRGYIDKNINIFKGIPYAQNQRFKPSTPAESWSGILETTEFGPSAPQNFLPNLLSKKQKPQSETDCLTLNIWTPGLDGKKRPVMIWIHGGGFISGSSDGTIYSGFSIAKRGNIVVVNFNYRLGILGLLYHPKLKDKKSGLAGNWGFFDQITALKWVSDNIEKFGGDPANVTIFGESAGSASVCLLMISPAARGLFHRVIAQSGAPFPATQEQGIEAAELVFKELGCSPDNIDKLRNMEIEKILEVQKKWQLIQKRDLTAPRPVLDGILLTHGPFDAINAGYTEGIELLIGSNRDEMKLFYSQNPELKNLNEERLIERLSKDIPNYYGINGDKNKIKRLLEIYRSVRAKRGAPVDPYELYCAMSTDYMLRIPKMRFAEKHQKKGQKSYTYLFTWESPIKGLGSCHALEITFVFGTLSTKSQTHIFTGKGPEAEHLSEQMQGAWISFAKGRGAATEDLGPWPEYDAEKRQTMIFGKKCSIQNAPFEPERNSWEEFILF